MAHCTFLCVVQLSLNSVLQFPRDLTTMRQLYYILRVLLVTLLALGHYAVAHGGCSQLYPESSDINGVIETSYGDPDTIIETEEDYRPVCTSRSKETATVVATYSCTGSSACEADVVKAVIDLKCVDHNWVVKSRTVLDSISAIPTSDDNCSVCLNQEERDVSYPDSPPDSTVYTPDNHCLVLTVCYSEVGCVGTPVAEDVTAQECCVSRDESGISYSVDGTCARNPCRVHGFNQSVYVVEEGQRVPANFSRKVKGGSIFPKLNLTGTILSQGHSITDAALINVTVPEEGRDRFVISAEEDVIALEYGESFILSYTHAKVSNFAEQVEELGEFVRDTAIVKIIDNDVLKVSFSQQRYDVNEDSEQQISVSYGATQKPFHLILTPDSSTADIPDATKATPGSDFNTAKKSVEIPGNAEGGSFDISLGDVIINDNTVEAIRQHFVMRAQFGVDVPSGVHVACFNEITGQDCVENTTIDVIIIDNDKALVTPSEFLYKFEEGKLDDEVCVSLTTNEDGSCPIEFPISILLNITNLLDKPPIESSGHAPAQTVCPVLNFASCDNSSCVNARDELDIDLEHYKYLNMMYNFSLIGDSLELHNDASVGEDVVDVITDVGTIHFMDNDPIQVALEETDFTVYEDVGSIEVCLQLVNWWSSDCPIDRDFYFNVKTNPVNSATPGEDYNAIGETPGTGTFLFKKCELEKCFNIMILDDDVAEPEQFFHFTVTLKLKNSDNSIVINGSNEGRVAIRETPLVRLTQTTLIVDEDMGEVEVCAEVSQASTNGHVYSIYLMTQDGTAVSYEDDETGAPQDYEDMNVLLSFEEDVELLCTSIVIRNDESVELSDGPDAEKFTVSLVEVPMGVGSSAIIDTTADRAEIYIVDDDMVVVELNESSYTVSEDDGPLSVCVNVTAAYDHVDCPMDFDSFISISAMSGSAGSPGDYEVLSEMVAIEKCGREICVEVMINDDCVLGEGDEVFAITLQRSPGQPEGVVFGREDAEVTITAIDEAITVGLRDDTVSEGDGVVRVCIEIKDGCSATFAFDATASTADDTAVSSMDYVPITQEDVTFEAGTNEVCIQFEITDDELVEDTEAVIFNVESAHELIRALAGVLKIEDNDTAVVGLDAPDSVEEGDIARVCLVVFFPKEKCEVLVHFSVLLIYSQGTNGNKNATLTYDPANCDDESPADIQCASIAIEDDEAVEKDELTLILDGRGLPPNIEIETDEIVIEIKETGDVGMVGLDKTRYEISEEEMELEVFVIVRVPDIHCPVTFPFNVTLHTEQNDTGGLALPGEDYVLSTQTLMFEPCQKERRAVIQILKDTVEEEEESFNIILEGDLLPKILLIPDFAHVIIRDVAGPTVGLEHREYTVSESEGTKEVCVVVSNYDTLETCPTIDVSLTSVKGTATSGVDFEAVNTTLRFEDCDEKSCVNVNILPDRKVETNRQEDFSLHLELAEDTIKEIRLSRRSTEVKINDSDMVSVHLEKTFYPIAEDTIRGLEVCVNVSTEDDPHTVEFPFKVSLSTVDGTAKSPDDFIALRGVDLKFESGVHQICKSTRIYDDHRLEHFETFTVILEGHPDLDDRIKISSVEGLVEIRDINDETIVGLEMAEYEVAETDKNVKVNVCAVVNSSRNDCPIEAVFSLKLSSFADVMDTAVASMDYEVVNEEIMFDSCELKKCVDVTIFADDLLEMDNQSFSISLAHSDELANDTYLSVKIELEPDITKVTIMDYINQMVTITLRDPKLHLLTEEEAKMLHVCADLEGSAEFDFTVNFEVKSGDVSAENNFVTVTSGETEVCANINFVDLEDEPLKKDEVRNYTVTLSRTADMVERIKLDPTHVDVYFGKVRPVQCFNSYDCSGELTVAASPRKCCVGSDESMSYSSNGIDCKRCIVHGFTQTVYDVEEGNRVNITFEEEVKGTSSFSSLALPLLGIIKSIPVGATVKCDYEDIGNVSTAGGDVDISLLTINDDITLEYDDKVKLVFKGYYLRKFRKELENAGEFIRGVAYVNIIDNDDLEINFDTIRYSIHENGTLPCNITLQHRNTQGCFAVHLKSVPVDYARSMFNVSDDDRHHRAMSPATEGKDFRPSNVSLVIPPSFEDPTTSTFIINQSNFDIVDDRINEYSQSFALFVEIEPHQEMSGETQVCFKNPMSGQGCSDFGAAEIVILDNDPIHIGFILRSQTVYESVSKSSVVVDGDIPTERSYGVQIDLLEAKSNATVEPTEGAVNIGPDVDAVFGSVKDHDFIGMIFDLSGNHSYTLETSVFEDTRPECLECFELRLSAIDSKGRDLFSCNKDDGNMYFCYHTFCIMDECDPCSVGFERPSYEVDETDGEVDVCVAMTCPENLMNSVEVEVFRYDDAVPAGYTLANGTFPSIICEYEEEEFDDYEQQILGCNRLQYAIIEQNERVCYNQIIYSDGRLESEEYAGLKLKVKEMTAVTDIKQETTYIKIIDNDRGVLGLQRTAYEIEEGGKLEVCVVVTTPAVKCPFVFPVIIYLELSSITAEKGSDFDGEPVVMYFDPCQDRFCVNISIYDDEIVEQDEEFLMIIDPIELDNRISLTPNNATVTITDMGGMAIVRLMETEYTVEETGDVTILAVVESPTGSSDCPVGFGFEVRILTVLGAGTAEYNRDYDAVDVHIPIEPCGQYAYVDVPIRDDDIVEGSEYFVVKLVNPGLDPRIKFEDTMANVTIIDDDRAQFGLKSTYCTINEYEADIEVCVEQKSPPNGCPVAFPFDLILDVQSHTAVSPTDYYTVNSTVVTFEPCEDEQCITIRIMDDETLEHHEVFTISLERPPGLTENIVLVNITKDVLIIDNDMIHVGFSGSSVAIEDSEKAKVCVEVRSPASDCPAAIPFELILYTEPDSATPEVDYLPVTIPLSFEVCDREVCVDIPLINDTILEDTEKFNVVVTELHDTNERIILEERERLYTIVDVDDATVEFESLYYSVDEGSSVEVCAIVTDPDLPCPIDFPFDIKVEVTASSADSTDYEVETTTLHFDACQKEQCVTISTVNDCNLEAREEVFKVALKRNKELDRRIRLNTTAATVVIRDDDYIFISLDESVYSVNENEGVARLCLVFSGDECSSTFPFGIHFQTHSDSAAPNEDYRTVNTIVWFGPSQSERCVDVRIINDTQVEQSESFDISLTPTTNLDDRIILVQDSAKVIIRNDDEATVGFTSDSVFIVEERGKVQVCVKIFSPDIESPVSYPFEISVSTTAGTADAYVDYVPPEGIFRFSAGEKEDCFDIEILDDEFLEPLETFTVSLMPSESLGNDIVFSQDTIVVRIIDRDAASVGFVDMGYEAHERDGSVLVCVEVKSSICIVNFAFSVTFKTIDGSADSPEDYIAQSTTLTFDPCESIKCIDVVLENDCVLEDTEAFNIRLETIDGQDRRIIIDPDTGNEDVTIIDDDAVVVGLEEVRYGDLENVGTIKVCAAIISPSGNCSVSFTFILYFNTTDDSAQSPADFSAIRNERLIFAPNQRRSCVDVRIQDDDVLEQTEAFTISLTGPDNLDERVSLVQTEGTVNIINDDVAVIGLEREVCVVDEDEGQMEVCVVVFRPDLDCPIVFPFDMIFYTTPGTAESEIDFSFGRETLRFGACEKRQCVNVTILEDKILEETESFTINLEKSPGLSNRFTVAPSVKTINITDNDDAMIGFVQTEYTVDETDDRVTVCIEVKNPTEADCLVNFPFDVRFLTIEESAEPDEDYVAQNTIVSFAVCETVKCLDVELLNDCVLEPTEVFRMLLSTVSGQDERIKIDAGAADVTINDDDAVVVGLEDVAYGGLENAGTIEVCAAILGECTASFPFTLYLNTSDDSADSPADFSSISDRRLVFTPNQRRSCTRVRIQDDDVLEQTEAFKLLLKRTPGLHPDISLIQAEGVVNIVNDDEAVIGLEREVCVVDEDVGEMEVCVVVFRPDLDCPIIFPFDMIFYTTPGTALLGSDYGLESETLRFDACAKRQCLMLPIVNDDIIEDTESFSINLEKSLGLSNRFTVDPSVKVINITDDDVATLGFDLTAYTVSESRGELDLCVVVTTPSTGCPINTAFTVRLSDLRGSATSPEDYNMPSTTNLEFNACDRRRCTEIEIVSSSQVEAVESFRLLLQSSEDNIRLSPQTATVDIIDDNSRAVVDMEESSYVVTEGDGGLTVCAVVSSPDIDCPVDFSFTINLSVGDDDYSIVFSQCETRACTFVRIADDNEVEESKIIRIQLERPDDLDSRITIGKGSADITIMDDPNDVAVVGFEKTFYQFVEEAPQTRVCISVYTPRGDCPIDFDFKVRLSTTDGSAESPSDYVSVSRDVTIQRCETFVCEQISITDDLGQELTETFSISLERTTDLDPRIRLSPVNGMVEIQDNDEAVVGLSDTSIFVNEGEGVVEVCLTVSRPNVDCPVMFEFRVTLRTTPDTAAAGDDFDSTTYNVRFESCQDIRCVEIDIVDDEQLEDTESFSISLLRNGLDEDIIVDPSAGVVHIRDDDRAVVGFDESAYQFDESVGTAVVCVVVESLRGGCVIPESLTLRISSSNGAAVSPDDYAAVSEEIRLAPCNPRVCVGISIVNDVVVENDEAFTLSLTSPTTLDPRINLNPHRAQVTINDNDAVNVRLNAGVYIVTEDVRSFEVCANLESPTTPGSECPVNFAVRVTLTSSDGTAVAGSDYGGVSMTLRFQTCATRSCTTVSIVNDVRMEAVRETFTLVLENTDQDSRISVSTQPSSVHIIDDDGVTIGLERSMYRVTESEGATVEICAVVRSPTVSCPIQTPVTVRFTTRDDTATTPSDYTSLPSTTVTFDSCDTRQCVSISITNDNKVEMEERFNVSMSRTVGLDDRVELERVMTTIEITDTDVATVEMDSTIVTVDEDDDSVDVCASVNDANGCRVQFAFAVTFSVTGSADSDDYTGVPVTLQFPACEKKLCVTVSIVDDGVVENNEELLVTAVSGGPADRISFGSGTANIQIIDNDDAVVRLKRLYMFAHENDLRVEVCAIVQDRKSVAFSFQVTFMFIEDSATHPEDFRTTSDVVTFAPTESEACAVVTLVNSVDLEMPESFRVTLQLTNPDLDDRIVVNEDYNEGEVEIIDDDVAIVGLERTSYRLNRGANSVEVCVYISDPPISITQCPITFPFDLIFRLLNPSAEYFVVDETQNPRPEGSIDREEDEEQDVILNFNSCQRRMCFDVSLKELVSGSEPGRYPTRRPEPGRYAIRIARTPDHGRTTILDKDKTSGFIEVL